MVGINNGQGVMAISGKNDAEIDRSESHYNAKMSENCFSTYNTPKFTPGYEFFPQLNVKKNPSFGQMGSYSNHR